MVGGGPIQGKILTILIRNTAKNRYELATPTITNREVKQADNQPFGLIKGLALIIQNKLLLWVWKWRGAQLPLRRNRNNPRKWKGNLQHIHTRANQITENIVLRKKMAKEKRIKEADKKLPRRTEQITKARHDGDIPQVLKAFGKFDREPYTPIKELIGEENRSIVDL